MNIYFISGLGADKRIFQKLKLPAEFQIHYLEWVAVFPGETINNYCTRLSSQINQTVPFILVGVSFGGVIAIELSRFLFPVQTVIISSFCFKKEVSKLYIFLGKIRIFSLFPVSVLLKPNTIIFRLFGLYNPEGKRLLTDILSETDPVFFRWAVRQLFSWDNHWKPASFLHIHGTADKILPFHRNMEAIKVNGGEHLMVYSKAGEVSAILGKKLLR
jgi:uncharacterized membrane protein